jgi:hypothetical protein
MFVTWGLINKENTMTNTTHTTTSTATTSSISAAAKAAALEEVKRITSLERILDKNALKAKKALERGAAFGHVPSKWKSIVSAFKVDASSIWKKALWSAERDIEIATSSLLDMSLMDISVAEKAADFGSNASFDGGMDSITEKAGWIRDYVLPSIETNMQQVLDAAFSGSASEAVFTVSFGDFGSKKFSLNKDGTLAVLWEGSNGDKFFGWGVPHLESKDIKALRRHITWLTEGDGTLSPRYLSIREEMRTHERTLISRSGWAREERIAQLEERIGDWQTRALSKVAVMGYETLGEIPEKDEGVISYEMERISGLRRKIGELSDPSLRDDLTEEEFEKLRDRASFLFEKLEEMELIGLDKLPNSSKGQSPEELAEEAEAEDEDNVFGKAPDRTAPKPSAFATYESMEENERLAEVITSWINRVYLTALTHGACKTLGEFELLMAIHGRSHQITFGEGGKEWGTYSTGFLDLDWSENDLRLEAKTLNGVIYKTKEVKSKF